MVANDSAVKMPVVVSGRRSGIRLVSRLRVTEIIPIALFFGVIALGFVGPLLLSRDPNDVQPLLRLREPSGHHFFGTDTLGRDVFTRTVYGLRTSLSIALVATTLSAFVGVMVGLICGTLGGRIDAFGQRVVDVVMAFPFLLLMIVIVSMLGPSPRNVVIGISFVMWTSLSRIVRSVAVSVRSRPFIEAASAIGCSTPRIIMRHIWPQTLGPVLVVTTANFASVIVAEASLSFLGMGVPPPSPSLGAMINEGRAYLETLPSLVIGPGIVLSLTVITLNLLGDVVRDRLDPTLRGR
ncbi:MAG: ABC transporter permease [Dehalococcoidia bacterium]